jgi:hypothetical protein
MCAGWYSGYAVAKIAMVSALRQFPAQGGNQGLGLIPCTDHGANCGYATRYEQQIKADL